MPELPEVETLAVELKKVLRNRKISEVIIQNESILQMPKEWLEKQMVGKKIVEVGRRSKFIKIDLTEGLTLWFHLGMTGQLLLEDPPYSQQPHTHFLLSFEGSVERLFYRDPRRFGRIALTPYGETKKPKGVERLGPEPNEWVKEEFVTRFKERKSRIKSLLLNQHLLAGLGNIYADESLYRAGIHPSRRAQALPRRRLFRLYDAIGEVLHEAIRWGGSSIDDYLHLDGKKGGFQHFHQVYGRQGEHCSHCGTSIRRIKLSGRSSFFCPRCQR